MNIFLGENVRLIDFCENVFAPTVDCWVQSYGTAVDIVSGTVHCTHQQYSI